MSLRYPEFPPDAPSVTEVLHSVGLIDDRWYTDGAADRGSKVHLACRYLAEDRLDWDSVDPEIEGYVRSYDRFLNFTAITVRCVEVQQYDEALKFCGTFDLEAKSGWVLDLKTGGEAKWHRAQVGGYWRLNGEKGKVGALYIQADGSTAKVKFYNGRECWNEFLTALNFYNLRRNYGISSS